MKRREWTFQRSAADLLKAAKERSTWNEKQMKWWEVQKKTILAMIKKRGFTFIDPCLPIKGARGSQGPQGAQGPSGHSGHPFASAPRIREDNAVYELQSELDDCFQKISEYATRRDEFRAWANVFSANPKQVLELQIDDYQHFYPES